MKKIFFLCSLSFLLIGGAAAQETAKTDPYSDAVQKLLTAMNSRGTFDALIPPMFEMFRQQVPTVPADFWDSAEQKLLEQAMDKMLEIYVPLYQEHFTLEEVNEMTLFYESPVGKKLSVVTPEISVKAMEGGQKWGVQIMQDLVMELQEKGYLNE